MVATVVGAVVTLAGGAAYAGASASEQHGGLSSATVLRQPGTAPSRVIVLLRNQHTNLPPTAQDLAPRVRAEASDQASLRSQVAASGGAVTHAFTTVNAVAATVSPAESAQLAADPAVAAVVPDTIIHLQEPDASDGASLSSSPAPTDPTGPTGPTTGPSGPSGPSGTTGTATGPSGPTGTTGAGTPAPSESATNTVCPSNPAHPLLEPEALALIHAASQDPSQPEADQLATGRGVTVAFAADGLDPNDPDFIRPDGSHVIVDYKDFTAEGLDAPTAGAEAFGDAASIAAQGRQVYDLSDFVDPAHPLPAGCNVIIRGVAPDVSLVALKVFPNSGSAFSSTILEGLDYAVATDHVDVLNESFGSLPLPDTFQDVLRQFDAEATAAGTVVTVSSGDQGTASTIGSPATDPSVIDVGATTQFEHFAQTERGAFQFASNGWLDDNIAEFSSGGFTQAGGTLDLVAPGNESYEPCDADVDLYADCTNFAGNPSNIRSFGGTSESSPLTAGVAALVIQAYRQTHGGSSPSPALVKSLITSNADDLNIPSDEQGAGELNALRTVQAAESVPAPGDRPAPSGDGLVISPSQLDLAADAGSGPVTGSFTVTNVGATTQSLQGHIRTLDQQLSDDKGDIALDANAGPSFVDQLGVAQSYSTMHFHIPAGADRIDAAIAWPQGASTVNLTLIDPQGRYAAFTYMPPGGGANYGHIDVRNPVGGTWTGVFFTPQGADGYTGPVHFDISSSRFGSVGTMSPSSGQLAPGASATVQVSVPVPAAAGDYSRDIQITAGDGRSTVVPVVVRSLVALGGRYGTFAGTLTGGDGDGDVAEENTYGFDVPPGAPGLAVNLVVPDDPGTSITGFLVAPDGQTLGQSATESAPSGPAQSLQIFARSPLAGRWRLLIASFSPVGGTTTAAGFNGSISLAAPTVSASGVPQGATIIAGRTVTARVRVRNTGTTPLNLFIDPREHGSSLYSLVSVTPAADIALPIPFTQLPPLFAVPTETHTLYATVQSSEPTLFDWGFADPDYGSVSQGNNAFGQVSGTPLAPGLWAVNPSPLGPFNGAAPATASVGMVALARTFDPSVTSSTGDAELDEVDATAPTAAPVVIAPGAVAIVTVQFTALGRPGSTSAGDLFVDDDQAEAASANEIADLGYSFTVGRRTRRR